MENKGQTALTGDTSQSADSDPGFTTQSWISHDANVAALSNGKPGPTTFPTKSLRCYHQLHECIHMMFNTYVGYRHHHTTGRKATPAFSTKNKGPRTS
jgi:hypothetical protein